MNTINKKSFLINLLGVVMSGAVTYSMNPVVIAYFAAAYIEKSMRYLLVISTVVGLLLWMPPDQAIKYISILFLFMLVCTWMERSHPRQKAPPLMYGIVASVISIGIGIGYSVQTGLDQKNLSLVVLESVVVFVLFQVFLKGIRYVYKAKRGQTPNNEQMISIVLMCSLIVYIIPEISQVEFTFKGTLAYLLILVLGYKYGSGAGAICGAAFGCVLYATSGVQAMIGVMCILGICAGIFRKVGKLGTGVAFLLCNIVMGYFYETTLIEVTAVRAIASAIAAFLLLPKRLIDPIELVSQVKEDVEVRNRIQEVAKSRLNDFAESFKTLSKTFYQISETKSNLSKEDVNFIFDELSDKLCKNCINCTTCWKNNFYDTYKAAFAILASAEQNGEVRKEDVPASFARQCLNLNSFLYETNRGLEMAKLNLTWHNRMAQSREAISGQLREVATIIQEFSTELYESVGVEQDLQEDIIFHMKQHHVEVKSVSVVEKRNKRQEFYITARSVSGRCITTKEAAKYLGEVLGKRMRPSEECKNIISKEYETILFLEDAKFKVLTGIAKTAKVNESISGDNFSFINLNNGEMIMTLSDGMGAGEQASEESQSVIELLEQFMEAGFKVESAIKLINSILVLRTEQSICSTIDMSVIDLFTGMCDFVKIGAAATFIKRGNWVETITSTSLPVGVFNQVDIDGVSKKLYDGDIVIMVSDGVLDSFDGEDKETIVAGSIGEIKSESPQEIAEMVLNYALEQSASEPGDDMTVLVAGMWKKS